MDTKQRILSSSRGEGSSGSRRETPLFGDENYSLHSLHTLHTADGSKRDHQNLNSNAGLKEGGDHPPTSHSKNQADSTDADDTYSSSSTTTMIDASVSEIDSAQENEATFRNLERASREALEAIAIKDPEARKNMADLTTVLRQYRRECASRAMYKEAHLVHQVLRSLRFEEEAQHIRGLTEHQMAERRRMEEIHREEFRAFHGRWNKRIDRFEEEQLEEEIRIVEQQNEELVAFHHEMQAFKPHLTRYSSGLVHSRLKEHTLARQQYYAKAYEVKEEGDVIEARDLERYEQTKGTMYGRRDRALRHRHQQALIALRNRVESRRNFLEQARKKELDELLQRYINARRELESHQNIVRSVTGTILLKHACNNKTDISGSHAITTSAVSGAYGPMIRKQTREYVTERKKYIEQQERERKSREKKEIKNNKKYSHTLSSSYEMDDSETVKEL